jgi:hypothetical protein
VARSGFIHACAAMLVCASPLAAAPVWRAPAKILVGELVTIEIVEVDPASPPMPRPGEEKLGPFALRSAVPIENGRGWRLVIQAFRPGVAVVPPMDLGQGMVIPELKIQVTRTVPFGAPWMGLGGGGDDAPPSIGFPWGWAALPLLPLGLALSLAARLWRRGAPGRRLARAMRRFAAVWPPSSTNRAEIDRASARGRELIASAWGEEARSWGGREFLEQKNAAWASWCNFIDHARFGGADDDVAGGPPFPTLPELIESMGHRR